jgi:hypothetical protein
MGAAPKAILIDSLCAGAMRGKDTRQSAISCFSPEERVPAKGLLRQSVFCASPSNDGGN